MKSIRRSLLLYYSFLVAVALAAVSLLVYHETQQTLQAKESLRAELLEKQYRENYKQEEKRLDNLLELQARTLAQQARMLFKMGDSQSMLLDLAEVSVLQKGIAPHLALLDPIWHSAVARRPPWHNELTAHLFWRTVGKIEISEDMIEKFNDDQIKEYFQINSRMGGATWRSPALTNRQLAFPTELARIDTLPLFDPHFDDFELEPGTVLRRVTFKAPVAAVKNQGPPSNPFRSRPAEGRGGDRDRAPQRGGERRTQAGTAKAAPGNEPKGQRGQDSNRFVPTSRPPATQVRPSEIFIVQCAATTTRRDFNLAELGEHYERDLALLHDETSETLASLRTRLGLLSITTFAASLLGGILLVRLGLVPLERLSEAVSKVSPKDFKLPYDEKHLPSELRPIVERLTQTLALLKRVFAREKQASADISHELRTPVAALLTMIEVALKKDRKPEEYREVLRDCQTTGRQMSKLVERLLVLARLDAGVDTLRPRHVDVSTLAEQCVDLVRPLAEARGLTLELERNGPIELVTDPDKLREVVTNLLHNAIEYNQPQGKVALAVARHNGTLELQVSDTGIGIPPHAREHIFERFYREDPSRGAEGLHAGLGLSIVKGYLDLMGGSIDVESEVGHGSIFRLKLPVARAASESLPISDSGR